MDENYRPDGWDCVRLLVTFDFPPSFGGIQLYIDRLAQALAARGERVGVVAPQQPGASDYDAKLPFRVQRFGGKTRVAQILRAAFATRESYQAIANGAADVATTGWTIASSWFPAGLAVAMLPKRSRGRLMILAHGSEIAARPSTIRDRLLRWTLARADCIVANSRFTAARVRAFYDGNAIAIVPCGVDERTIDRKPSPIPTILFVGRLVPRKGVDRLIEALPDLSKHLGLVQLEIIGNGPDRERLEQLAVQCDCQDRVRFLGAVSDEERDAAYARAWCFAMPSRAEGDDVEGFGIVYLEAAIAGLPSIGGRGSGADDAIVDGVTGFVVDGTDNADVTRALLELLRDPARAQAMGDAGRTRAMTDFSWTQNAAAIERVLAETI